MQKGKIVVVFRVKVNPGKEEEYERVNDAGLQHSSSREVPMKAAVINQFGDEEVLKVQEVDTPKPRPGHILIKVLAAGVNRLDHYIREGSIVPELAFPHILGADAAGLVAGIGENVTGFSLDERVILVAGWPQDEKEYDIHPASIAPSFGLPGLHPRCRGNRPPAWPRRGRGPGPRRPCRAGAASAAACGIRWRRSARRSIPTSCPGRRSGGYRRRRGMFFAVT